MTHLRPYGPRLLVKRYQYPEMVGSIYLPVLQDQSNTLWDLVSSNLEAEEELGIELEGNYMIETPSGVAVSLGIDNLWVIYASNVITLIPWEDNDDGNDGAADLSNPIETTP